MQATVMVRCSLLASVLLAAGCFNYWGRRRVDQPTPVKPYQPVWIWSGGQVKKWHAVVITQDSVSGIPYTAHGPRICHRRHRHFCRAYPSGGRGVRCGGASGSAVLVRRSCAAEAPDVNRKGKQPPL